MNFHTNNDRSITVNIMESSISHFVTSQTIISNITSATFQSYSEVNSIPGLINLEAVDLSSKIITPGVPTKYNILASKDMLTSSKIYTNPGYTENEIDEIRTDTSAFLAHKSAVYFDRIAFTTDYRSLVTTTIYMNVINVKANEFNITNCNFKVAGQILYTLNPIRLKFESVDIDYSWSRNGAWVRSRTGSVEELSKTYVISDTVNIFYTEPKRRDLGQRHVMLLLGTGD